MHLSTAPLATPLRILQLLAAAAALSVGPASAADFTVSKLTDSNDGVCNSDCSLREAVRAANALVGADTITLPAGTLTLSIPGRGENDAATGDLDVTGDVQITGQGVETTRIDGNGTDRVFDVFTAAVEIEDLTILGGRAEGGDHGGGVANDGTLTMRRVAVRNNRVAGNEGGGGGIYNTSVLRVEQCSIADNSVTGTNGIGGGVENTSDLEMVASTIRGNQTTGFFGNGGGLINSSEATLTNTTVSGNQAGGMQGDGGGISNSSELMLINSTLHANSAGDDGDAIAGTGFSQIFTNTLISGDCAISGPVTSQGGNLESPGNTCGLGASDQTGVAGSAVDLGPLADHGGPTLTHALGADSRAIDRALNGPCPVEDQRGQARPADGDGNGSVICDVGAFEVSGGCCQVESWHGRVDP